MNSPREIADERLAQGEIGLEEHARLIELLGTAEKPNLEANTTRVEQPETAYQARAVKSPTTRPLVATMATRSYAWLWWLLGGVGVFIALVAIGEKQVSRKQGNWAFIDESSSSKTRRYLTLLESGSTNTYSKTTLRVACMSDGMDVEVMWGAPMKNMYPDKSVPTSTRVSAQFGDSAVWDMGWQPSSDGFVTRAPGVQLDVASGIDSFLFSLLGMDSISKKNKEMFNWTAEQFVNRIAKQAHSSSENHFLRLSAKNTSNSKLTLKFDLTGFNELANQHFKGVCIN